MARDYYATLGVSRSASEKDIREAYRRLARKYHPDLNPANKAASEARFKEINEAYEVLSDPEKRRKYDQFGENWKHADRFGQAPPGPETWSHTQAPFDFDLGDATFGGSRIGEILEELLQGGRRTGTRTAPRPGPGPDVEQPVEVSLEEAFSGASRLIQTVRLEPCAACRGQGRLYGRACAACMGSGAARQPKRLEVKIPQGVKDGSRVRIAGEGNPGIGGGPRGDLYLVISVRPHPQFQRQGDDLHTEVSLPLTDAILGGKVEVPTLRSRVVLNIPPETQNGQVFRLAGQGMPRLGDSARGDLYARVRVELPRELGPRERELFEELRRLHGKGR